jgi:hypothetical protein
MSKHPRWGEISSTPWPPSSASTTFSHPTEPRMRLAESAGGRARMRTPSIAVLPAPAAIASRRRSVLPGSARSRLARVWRR